MLGGAAILALAASKKAAVTVHPAVHRDVVRGLVTLLGVSSGRHLGQLEGRALMNQFDPARFTEAKA